jgi:hypothetical protein
MHNTFGFEVGDLQCQVPSHLGNHVGVNDLSFVCASECQGVVTKNVNGAWNPLARLCDQKKRIAGEQLRTAASETHPMPNVVEDVIMAQGLNRCQNGKALPELQ